MPHLQYDQWFPLRGSKTIVGRFVDVDVVHGGNSEKAGKTVYVTRTILEQKIAGKSDDISTKVVKPNNTDEVKRDYPGAWEHYEALKSSEAATGPAVNPANGGTALEEAQCYNNDRITWFKSQGITSLEQVADLSDTTIGSMGHGARGWRKKAREYLASQGKLR